MSRDLKTTDRDGQDRACITQAGAMPPRLEREWSLRIAEVLCNAVFDELADIAREHHGPVSANCAVSGFMTALNQLVVEASDPEDRPEIWANVKDLIDQIVAGDVM